ncbi:MAG: hypothetical protein F6K24_53845 [Okeania sp. SIO2D1]|nr:hypothetical protein [Okeania sp. SIO2D1]
MKKSLYVIFCLLIVPYLAWRIFQYSWYQGAIPEKIDVTYALNISGNGSIIRDACGAAIFKITNTSANIISRDGLFFLQDAIYPRNSENFRHIYKPWKKTPVPDSWTSEGTWPGLSCSNASRPLIRKIIDAAKNKGSYYTSGSARLIVVIPHLKLVVFSYFG